MYLLTLRAACAGGDCLVASIAGRPYTSAVAVALVMLDAAAVLRYDEMTLCCSTATLLALFMAGLWLVYGSV